MLACLATSVAAVENLTILASASQNVVMMLCLLAYSHSDTLQQCIAYNVTAPAPMKHPDSPPARVQVRRAIARLLTPSLQSKEFVHTELLRIAGQCAPSDIARFPALQVTPQSIRASSRQHGVEQTHTDLGWRLLHGGDGDFAARKMSVCEAPGAWLQQLPVAMPGKLLIMVTAVCCLKPLVKATCSL